MDFQVRTEAVRDTNTALQTIDVSACLIMILHEYKAGSDTEFNEDLAMNTLLYWAIISMPLITGRYLLPSLNRQ